MFGRNHDIDNSFSHDCETSIEREEKLKEFSELVTEYKKDIKTFLDTPVIPTMNSSVRICVWEDEYKEVKDLLTKLLELA